MPQISEPPPPPPQIAHLHRGCMYTFICVSDLHQMCDIGLCFLDDARASISVFGLRNAQIREWISVAQGVAGYKSVVIVHKSVNL